MKKLSIIIILSVLTSMFLVSCGNNSSTPKDTHTHADGTVHEGTTHTEAPAAQESFQVEGEPSTDNSSTENHEHEHDHDSHDHSDHKH